MRTIDVILMGIKNLIKRKARTTLTVLGVMIGTAAIILMISLGIGTSEANEKAIESERSVHIINVSSYYYPPEGENGGRMEPSQGVLDDSAIATIAAFPEVEAASPMLYEYFNVVSGKYKTSCSFVGLNADIIDKLDLKLAQGRLIEDGDANVALFGFRIPYSFYNTRSNSRNNYYYYGFDDMSAPPPVDVFADRMVMTSDWSYGERKQPGEEVSTQKPKLYNLAAIGLLDGNADMYSEYDYSVIVNIDWLLKVKAEEARRNQRIGGGGGGIDGGYGGGYGGGVMVSYGRGGAFADSSMSGSSSIRYDQAIVRVREKKDVEAVQKMINEMGLGANSSLDWLKYMQESTGMIRLLLGAIAAVSLLVAAINIANTMIMSVYERTKEIAIMKVLGCKLSNIGQLFLFEAGLIGFFGGVIGVGASYLGSFLLNKFGGNIMQGMGAIQMPGGETYPVSVIPLWLVLLAMAFATVIGVVFGFWPARRAMKMSALKALRNE